MLRRLLPPWLRSLVQPFRRQAALALLLGLIAYGCAALLMFASGFLISKTADPATTLFMVMTPVACVQLFGLGRPIARYFERLASHDWVMRVTSQLRLKLFRTARSLQTPDGPEGTLGTYLSALTADIGHLQNLFLRVAFPTAIALLLFGGACVLCGCFSPLLLLLMVLCGIACVLGFPCLALGITRELIGPERIRRSQEYDRLTDDVLGIADYQLAGRSTQVCACHGTAGRQLAAERAQVRRRQRLVQLASVLTMGVFCAAILAWCGNAWGGGGQANWIAAFALGFFPLAEVFALLPASLSEAAEHEQAIENLGALFRRDGDSATPTPAPAQSTAAGIPGAAAVQVENLGFSYPGSDRAALDGITLSLEAGSKTALLGRSGSGKSTLLSVLQGSRLPQEGTVQVGGGGTPALLDQQPYLFDRTLRQNLALAAPDASDAAMAQALGAVGLETKAASLTEGLDTAIGETGMGFSGGQAHRVALARVLLGSHPLVLLDEPFNALDPATEEELLDTLFRCFEDTTLVVATHHLAGIDRFDRVIFMEEGRVVLDGSPAQLRETSPRFRRLLAFDGKAHALGAKRP